MLLKETFRVIMMLKKLLTFRVITKSVTKTSCVITHHRAEPVIRWNVTRRTSNYRYQSKTKKEASQSRFGSKRRKKCRFLLKTGLNKPTNTNI